MNVMSVEKLSAKPHALFSITKCTGKRNHMITTIMKKLSVTTPILLCSKKFTLERESLIVMHGTRTSVREHTLSSMKGSIPKRNLTNAMNLGKHLVKFRHHSVCEKDCRSHICTECGNVFSHSLALGQHQNSYQRETR